MIVEEENAGNDWKWIYKSQEVQARLKTRL